MYGLQPDGHIVASASLGVSPLARSWPPPWGCHSQMGTCRVALATNSGSRSRGARERGGAPEQSQLELAQSALEKAVRACGALVAGAVAALFELCGERLTMLDAEFAPRLAAASARRALPRVRSPHRL